MWDAQMTSNRPNANPTDAREDATPWSETGKHVGAVLVAGAGISGMQAALDLADGGYYVYLLDREPAIGGLMSKLDKTFPTNDCAMCVMSPKLVDCGRHLNIELITYADVAGIEGEPGNYRVKILRKAKSVDETKCTGCEDCVTQCPSRYRVRPQPEEVFYGPELAPEERDFIERLLREETDVEGNLLWLLQEISHYYRYLPQHALEYLADRTGLPLAKIISVVTFYSAFSLERKGEHTISICRGTACHVKRSRALLKRIEEVLGIGDGQTTADWKFTLETVRCLGCCALAPAIRIGEETFGRVRVGDLEGILGKF